jgi:hypothetical protein
MLTIKDILKNLEEVEALKFVRVNGKYRFIRLHAFCADHASLVKAGEEADSAGLINVTPAGWYVMDDYSMSLRLRMKDDSRAELTKLFKRPELDRLTREPIDAGKA